MPLAPTIFAQNAIKNVAKRITAPIYFTQPFLLPLAELPSGSEKREERLQQRVAAAGIPAVVHYITRPNKLLVVMYTSFQLPTGDTIAQQALGLLASAGVPSVKKKSVVMASSRVILETI